MTTKKISALLLSGLFLAAVNVNAAAIVFELDTAYVTPEATPTGTPPWLAATFVDVASNLVQLTMTTPGLAVGTPQSVVSWFFNTDATLPLSFVYVSGDDAGRTFAPNSLEAGGGRFFDIEFDFLGGLATGEQSVFQISSIDPAQPISSASFSFLSSPDTLQPNFYSAALVGGIGNELSSWIAAPTLRNEGPAPVPEPATLLLLGAGLTGLGFFGRKKFVN